MTLHPVTRKMLAAEGWEEYATMLQEGGYGDIAALMDADADDLKELGIKTGHAKRLLKMLGRSPGAMLAREGSMDFEDTAEGEKRPVAVPAESESEEGSSEEPRGNRRSPGIVRVREDKALYHNSPERGLPRANSLSIVLTRACYVIT